MNCTTRTPRNAITKKTVIAGLLILAMAGCAVADTTVTLVGTYTNTSATPSLNTWGMYALDPALNGDGSANSNDGISFVSFKVGNVLDAFNDSPDTSSYLGNNTNTVVDRFGFSSSNEANALGSGAFEIICGQNPNALRFGTTDPNTGSPLFLEHVGQAEVSYTYENKDGTQSTDTVGTSITINGITGHWLKVAQGTVAQGAVPTIIDYNGGFSAAANLVDAGLNATSPVTTATAIFMSVDVVLPTVVISSPTSGSSVALGSTVTLVATASTTNPGGSLTSVQFFDDEDELLGSGTLAGGTTAGGTWTFAWDTTDATVGPHDLTVQVTDNLGTQATSTPATVVNVVTPPTVAITSPTSPAVAPPASSVNLVATASTTTPGGSVATVQFFDGTTLLGSATRTGGTAANGTWTFAWATTGATVGLHNLTARATDAAGLTTTSSPAVVVNVVSAPSVVITSPTSTAPVVLGDPVTLTATTSTANTGGSLTAVQFFDGTTLVGSGSLASGTAASGTWTFAWDTTGATVGLHNIKAGAADNFGLTTTSSPATVVSVIIAPAVTLDASASTADASLATAVVLTATASTANAGGTIAGVQFYDGATLLGSGTRASGSAVSGTWTYAWSPTGATLGSHTFTAKATDNFSLITTSPPAVVAVIAPPGVTITSPTSTYSASLGSAVNLTATATKVVANGVIMGVQFYDGATLLGSAVMSSGDNTGGTWTYVWNTTGATVSLHNITAKASDNFGLTATSSPATVINVITAPTVAITSPTSTFAAARGNTVTVTATASTANVGGSIASVQFYDGPTLLGSGTRAGGTTVNGTWTYGWATTGATVGLHNLTALATDNFSQTVGSSPATVVNVITPPAVAITSPTSTFSVGLGSTVALTATASTASAGGSLTAVQFYNGTALLGSATRTGGTAASGTWTYGWVTAGTTVGLHNVTAKATDNSGLAVTSSPATVINITMPPSVAMTAPTNSSVAAPGATVALKATASTGNAGGSVASVQFYDGATLLGSGVRTGGTVVSGTWTYGWATTGATAGLHNLTARATDNLSVTTASSPATVVNVLAAPGVTITVPTSPFAATRGSPVALTATASTANSGGSLTAVQFYDGTTLLGSATRTGGTAASGTWTYGWVTTSGTVGLHNLKAKATDNFGLTATSSPATVINLITAPSVAITSPTSTTNVAVGGTVTLTATASTADAGGSLTAVRFYDGTTLLGSATRTGGTAASGTWTYGWSTASATLGLHNLTARATDNFGLAATSAPAKVVRVNTAPVVAITAPVSPAVAAQGSKVSLTATASTGNSGGTITAVRLYDGATLLGSAVRTGGTPVNGTWTYVWTTTGAAVGLHNVTAQATDNYGLAAASSPATIVNIITPPSVAITSPTSTYVAGIGSTVALTATASTADSGGSVTAVRFYNGTTLVGSATRNGGTAVSGTWTFGWDTTGTPIGLHNLTARATDNFGLSATSAPATVVNVLTPPTVAITSPTDGYDAMLGDMITLKATASTTSAGDSIAWVDFFDDGGFIGMVRSASGGVYTLAWDTDGATAGLNHVYAIAVDKFLLPGVSAPVEIMLGVPPTVAITSPTSPLGAVRGSTITLTATAATVNPDATIEWVVFFDGGTFIGLGEDAGGGTYTLDWNTTGMPAGANKVIVIAMDSFGYENASWPPTVINLGVAPTVAIVSPTSTFAATVGDSITLTATASTANAGGSIAGVEFFDGAGSIGVATAGGGGGAYTLAWDTTSSSTGRHNLTARATDNIGLAATSSPPTVVNLAAVHGAVIVAQAGAAPRLAQGGLAADGNGDGIVDGVDYGIWQNGYLRTGAGVLAGDYNSDGVVDGADYGVWQNAYGQSIEAIEAVAAAGQDDPASAVMTAADGLGASALAAPAPESAGIAPRLIAVAPASGSTVSGVTSVTLGFDSDVLVGASAVEVSGLTTGPRGGFSQQYTAATRTLTLSWAAPLAADVYTVRVIGSFVVGSEDGEALDGATGNPAAATLPSGCGTPGSDAQFEFTAQ
jgi:hypothetical protein